MHSSLAYGGGDVGVMRRHRLVGVTAHPHRRTAVRLLALAGVTALASAACSQNFDAAMSKREVVVMFAPHATRAQQQQVRDACAKVTPRTVPEPMPTGDTGVNRRYAVRFRVDKATDGDLTKLDECLKRHKVVIGVNDPDAGS